MTILAVFFIILFLISLAALLHSFLLYPLILAIKTRNDQPFTSQVATKDLPGVSCIILVDDQDLDKLNEAIESALEQVYPREKLEIIVAPWGTDTRVDAVVKMFEEAGVRLVRPPRALGRTLTANFAARNANGDVLVFSDADAVLSPDALQMLAKALMRPFVGVVSGREMYEYSAIGQTSQKFVRWYQKFLHNHRTRESNFGTLGSVAPSIYAIRREDYHPVEKDMDPALALPLEAACIGKRSIYEPKALVLKKRGPEYDDSFDQQLKRAISAAAFTRMFFKNKHRIQLSDFTFCVISGRVLKWLAPYWILLMFVATLFLSVLLVPFLILLGLLLIPALILLTVGVLHSFGKQPKGTDFMVYAGSVFGAYMIGFYKLFVEKEYIQQHPKLPD